MEAGASRTPGTLCAAHCVRWAACRALRPPPYEDPWRDHPEVAEEDWEVGVCICEIL